MKQNLRGLFGALALVGAALTTPLVMSNSATAATSSSGSFTPIPKSQQVNITYLTYMPVVCATCTAVVNSFVSGFEAAYPNIHVTVQSAYPTIPALQQDEAAGNIPAVTQGTFDGWRYMVTGLGAQNLTKLFGAKALSSEFGGQDPYAVAVTKLAMMKNDVYGIPYTLSTPILFYNASLFTKAGLNPADPPTTWEQLKTDLVQIKSATGAQGISNGCLGLGQGTTNTDWCLQAIIDSAGGKVISTNLKTLDFDSPSTVYALKVMADLANAGVMPNLTTTQAYQEFAQGKLAAIFNSSVTQSTLLTEAQGGGFTLADAAMPGFGTKATKPTNSGSGLFITAKDPLQQRAAWEFIKYLTSAAGMTAVTEQVGYPPLRPGLANNPSYLASWKHTNSLVAVNLKQLKHLVAYQGYPGPNYYQIVTTLANAATNIVFQGGNAKSLLTTAQSQAASFLP